MSDEMLTREMAQELFDDLPSYWEPSKQSAYMRALGALIDGEHVVVSKVELARLYDIFQIGSATRNLATLLVNVRNTSRRADCLSAIENEFFMVKVEDEDSDGEPMEESQLSWGANPAEYVEQFRASIIAERDRLRAELDALSKQEPVCYVDVAEFGDDGKLNSDVFIYHEPDFELIPLYSRPAPGEKK